VEEVSRRLSQSAEMRRLDDGVALVAMTSCTPCGKALALNEAAVAVFASGPPLASFLERGQLLPAYLLVR
jgi:hypothetical protein